MFPLSALGGLPGFLANAPAGSGLDQLRQQMQNPSAEAQQALQQQDQMRQQGWNATVPISGSGWYSRINPDTGQMEQQSMDAQLGAQTGLTGGPPASGAWGPTGVPGAQTVPWGNMRYPAANPALNVALQQAGQMGTAGLYGIQKPMGGGWASAYGGMGGGLSPLAPWLGSLMGRGVTPWNRQF